MRKSIIIILTMLMLCLTGCGNKSNSELVDIEQFKCQDDIQTVFDVLGEVEMGTNAFGSEHYKYENLNLYGYNGYTYFGVRSDKKTIQDIECYLTLTKKEFEDVLSQFSEKYGSYEVANYSGNTKTYRWKIEEKKFESLGFNDIHIQENDKNEYMIVFKDEMSSKTDEFYFESLKEKEADAEQAPINTILQKKYEIDGEQLGILLGEKEGKIKISIFGHAKTEEKACLMLAYFLDTLKKLDSIDGFAISISCEDLYVMYSTTESGYVVVGTNRDGSTSISAPDWIVTDFTMTEDEMDIYIKEIDDSLKDFVEDIQ